MARGHGLQSIAFYRFIARGLNANREAFSTCSVLHRETAALSWLQAVGREWKHLSTIRARLHHLTSFAFKCLRSVHALFATSRPRALDIALSLTWPASVVESMLTLFTRDIEVIRRKRLDLFACRAHAHERSALSNRRAHAVWVGHSWELLHTQNMPEFAPVSKRLRSIWIIICLRLQRLPKAHLRLVRFFDREWTRVAIHRHDDAIALIGGAA